MRKETEVMDKLFLELSQFTTAKTRRELKLEKQLEQAKNTDHNKLRKRTKMAWDEWNLDMITNPEMLPEWGAIRPSFARLSHQINAPCPFTKNSCKWCQEEA